MTSAMDMFQVQHTQGTVLCCLCGTSIPPNPSNMCVACIRTQVDITEGLQKQITVLYCRECGRYLQPPRVWIKANLESKELLTYCLKRVKNLNKVKLVDAGFVWTEPHSKRLKVKLTIQKEVFNGAILQQSFVIDYVVEDHMCDQCSRLAANPDQWIAVVQLRQKADHKRTFFFLEQLILKHGADANTINIKQMHDGVDFFYANRSHALKLIDFLDSVVPIQFRHDKQLVSQDSHSNTYNYKFTFSVEICPVCKDDLVCLPRRAASSLGNVGPLVLCHRVSNNLQLLDPATLRLVYLDSTQYWRYPFKGLLSAKQLVEYIVLDIEELQFDHHYLHGGKGGGATQADNESIAPSEGWAAGGGGKGMRKFSLVEVQVARISDFGKNDTIFNARTHLGGLLKAGDHALGYDLYSANLNDEELDKYKGLELPDVVLVKKSYEATRKKRRGKPRPWKLKSLAMEVDTAMQSKVDEERRRADYEKFLEDVEEDPEMRAKIAVYRDQNYQQMRASGIAMTPSAMSEADGDEEFPEIPLEELLSELQIEETDNGSDHEMEVTED